MSMYFLDDTDDWPEYGVIKDDIHRLEQEQIKLRKELQKAEVTFGSDPANQALKARVARLENNLKEIEKKLEGSLSMYR